MTLTWVICGAGRRVGKTHLAQQLCALLPDAAYAKQGHGPRRAGKPPNFFHTQAALERFIKSCRGRRQHVVVESNALARKGAGDIIIFIDGIPGRTNFRADVPLLRARAHLHVGPAAAIRDWRRVLRQKLRQPRLCGAVCDLLVDHQRFLSRAGPVVRTKVWLALEGMHAFGSGLARLLEAINQCGTLRAAARLNRMSYRHAWDLIRHAQKHLGRPLIVPQAGGVGGGRSTLSPEGRHLLAAFRQLEREVATFARQRAAELLKPLGRSGT